ncbi:EAL domain-containing protein [Acidovorax sp. RAC01]|uniref:EAL domain-containing protein n=1 Tax=Acidovorax sp. RAC01 TaxID=1842533 RepID=UPI000857E546|nr:EAL domain-containing protein [Acidovorax sp. RAC01]AOG21809.1 diguanylate cyclase domain protein [Acidovorax sp. RAC01]
MKSIQSVREFERRKAFLSLTSQDEAALRKLHDVLGGDMTAFVDSLYEHLLSFSETRALIKGDDMLAQLKKTQAVYFGKLTAGPYDANYLEDRSKVGLAHARVGLSPGWYLGAYSQYLSGLLPLVAESTGGGQPEFIDAFRALIKVVFLDISVALDAYIAHRDDLIADLRDYGAAFAHLPYGTLVTTDDLKVVFANQAFEKLFGFAPQSVRGTLLNNLMNIKALEKLTRRALKGAMVKESIELLPVHSSLGVQVSVTVHCLPSQLPGDEVRLLFVFEDLREQTKLLRDLLDAQSVARIGTWQTYFDGSMSLTPQAARIMGVRSETVTFEKILTQIHPADFERVMTRWEAASRGGPLHAEFRVQRSNSIVWVEVRGKIVRDEADNPVHAYGTVLDITERKAAEKAMEQLAFYDTLTRLPNRAHGVVLAKNALERAHQKGRRAVVMFIDLDRFKDINDSQGHTVGDHVLVEVARRCEAVLDEHDAAARMGGDEFMCVHLLDEAESVSAFAERLHGVIAGPIKVGHLSLDVGASIGIALYKTRADSIDLLLQNADIAMYASKARGGGWLQYTGEMRDEIHRRTSIGNKLGHAITSSHLQLHYQAKVNIETGALVGVEALTRWDDAELGTVSPSEFIPIAESRGLISQLGDWALTEACALLAQWQALGVSPMPPIAVNVAPSQIADEDFPQRALHTVLGCGVQPQWIEFEITESALMQDPDKARNVALRLTRAGFSLSIDDFGTGYSSLARLRSFPVSKLKVDMSFVRDMIENEDSLAIVTAVISMAKALHMHTVAEGVETAQQLQVLGGLQCDQAQGYYVGKPMSGDDITARWLPAAVVTQLPMTSLQES